MADSILEATPETDANIVSIEFRALDDDVSTASPPGLDTNRAWTGWYRHPRGGVYAICRDPDGYLVYKPGGGIDAWGAGYTWRDVKSGYGLAGVAAYQSRYQQSCR